MCSIGNVSTSRIQIPLVSSLLPDDTLQSETVMNRAQQFKLNECLCIRQCKAIVLPVFRTSQQGFLSYICMKIRSEVLQVNL